jgi:K+-sensing histidine kinase KdpD
MDHKEAVQALRAPLATAKGRAAILARHWSHLPDADRRRQVEDIVAAINLADAGIAEIETPLEAKRR